jgi:hypothetical protein
MEQTMSNNPFPLQNQLLQEVQYKVDETSWGVWRRFLYPDGQLFEEFTSHASFFGLPWLHYTRGKCPETGKRIVAKGMIAVGRRACGLLAIGQASLGLIAIGQLAIGLLFGFGQACTGLFAFGQLALAAVVGIGQIVSGNVAVGQIAIGQYVLAQFGFGAEVWDTRAVSPVAKQFFESLIP